MNCVITNGTCYIKRDGANPMIAVDSLAEATVFVQEKAEGTMTCLPKSLQDKGFAVKELSEVLNEIEGAECDDELTTDDPSIKNYVSDVEESEKLHNLKQSLLYVDKVLGALQGVYADVCKELSDTNLEIIDIEHAIEFMKPNAAKAYYLESELKKARLKRRECKDIKTLLETVMMFKKNDWGTGRLQKAIDRSEKRSYRPRIRRDLFE